MFLLDLNILILILMITNQICKSTNDFLSCLKFIYSDSNVYFQISIYFILLNQIKRS